MLHKVNINWNDFDSKWKNGAFMEDDSFSTPIFTQNREVVEKYLTQE